MITPVKKGPLWWWSMYSARKLSHDGSLFQEDLTSDDSYLIGAYDCQTPSPSSSVGLKMECKCNANDGFPFHQCDNHCILDCDRHCADNGNFGIWVWIGKRASEGERREAMRNAQVGRKKLINHHLWWWCKQCHYHTLFSKCINMYCPGFYKSQGAEARHKHNQVKKSLTSNHDQKLIIDQSDRRWRASRVQNPLQAVERCRGGDLTQESFMMINMMIIV